MTDKEVRRKMLELQTEKAQRCAEYLKVKGVFRASELENALREFGVGRAYFERMYQLDWQYIWVKKYTMTFQQFLEHIVHKASFDHMFETEMLDSLIYKKRYRLNGENIDYYEQEYVWNIAFMKKSTLY